MLRGFALVAILLLSILSSTLSMGVRVSHADALIGERKVYIAMFNDLESINKFAEISRNVAEDIRVLPLIGAVILKSSKVHASLIEATARKLSGVVFEDYAMPLIDFRPGSLVARSAENRTETLRITGVLDSWRMGLDGRGIRIALLDTGIYLDHPWLRRGNRSVVVYTYDATGKVYGSVCVDPITDMPAIHGTAVASIIASQSPEYPGVAPGVDIYNVIVFRPETRCQYAYVSDILEGLEWSLRGPDGVPRSGDEPQIVSISLGASVPPWLIGVVPQVTALLRALETLVNSGITVVVAAGNEGPGGYTLNVLCAARGVLCVGAADRSLRSVADFSSWGPLPWGIPAPDLVAPGEGLVAAVPPNRSLQLSGTSLSAPFVAGVVALLKQYDPSLQPAQIKSILTSTSTQLAVPYYYGPPPISVGGGLINASAAIRAQLSLSVGNDFKLLLRPSSTSRICITSKSHQEVRFYTYEFYSYLGASAMPPNVVSIKPQQVYAAPLSTVCVDVSVAQLYNYTPGYYFGYIVAETRTQQKLSIPVSVEVPATMNLSEVSYGNIYLALGASSIGLEYNAVRLKVFTDESTSLLWFAASSRTVAVVSVLVDKHGNVLTGSPILVSSGDYILVVRPLEGFGIGAVNVTLISFSSLISNLTVRISDIAFNVSILTALTDQAVNQIAELANTTTNLKNQLVDLSGRQTALENMLREVHSNLSGVYSLISDLNSSLADHSRRLDELNLVVSNYSETLNTIMVELRSAKESVSQVQEAQRSLEQRVSELVEHINIVKILVAVSATIAATISVTALIISTRTVRRTASR